MPPVLILDSNRKSRDHGRYDLNHHALLGITMDSVDGIALLKRAPLAGLLLGTLLLGGCAATPLSGVAEKRPAVHAKTIATPIASLSPGYQAVLDVLTADLARKQGDDAVALTYYQKALRLIPEPALAEEVVALAVMQGKQNMALAAARRWTELSPKNPDAWRAAGLLEARLGQVEPATADLRRFLGLDGYRDAKLNQLAAVLAHEVKPGEALRIMREFVADSPDDARAHYAYGLLAQRLNYAELALREAKSALKIDPGLYEAIVLQADALVALERPEAALNLLRAAMQRNPEDVDLQLAYAEVLVQSGRYADVRVHYQRLLRQHPHNSSVLYGLAVLEFDTGRYPQARRYFQRLGDGASFAGTAAFFLGRIDEREHRPIAALRRYSEVNSGPFVFAARVRIAYLLAELGQVEQARDYLDQLRQLVTEPARRVDLYLIEAEIDIKADNDAKAMKVYGQGLRHHPGNPRLRYARALLAEKMGNLRLAEADLKSIVSLHPDDAMALNALGYILVEHTDRYTEAQSYIRRALELKPNAPAILDSMGWVQYRLGNYSHALVYLRQAYAEAPDPEIAAHLVEALLANGQPREADDVLRTALKKFPHNSGLMNLQARIASSTQKSKP